MPNSSKPRVSPAASPAAPSTNNVAVVVDTAPTFTSWTTTSPPKKSRFGRLRKRTSSNTVPTYTRSLSSSQFSVDSSSAAAAQQQQHTKKKKSLLKRLIKYSTGSTKTKLVIETHPEGDEHDEDHTDLPVAEDVSDSPVNQEASLLEQRGLAALEAGHYEDAIASWEEALGLCDCNDVAAADRLTHQIKCRLISLHLLLHAEEEQHINANTPSLHLTKANQLIAELQPLDDDDGCALGLVGSPLLLELLMKHSCWALALQVSHTMPDMDPLTLARLHLEVALEDGEGVVETYHDEDDTTVVVDPLLGEKRFQQLSHLSECHQLLLSLDATTLYDHDDVSFMNLHQDLWQQLAQAYGLMGEEELALGCCQSRLQHLTSPVEVALAHYDQALNVLSPVGQYELALKEGELALDILQRSYERKTTVETNDTTTPDSSNTLLEDGKERVNDGDDVDILWMKLYQFKADVLCRMGHITESIQSYEMLLQAFQQSSNHGPTDVANVLYILGKLSVRAKRFNKALEYFDEEAAMTKSVVGHYHMAISKILHESARVCDAGMMDYPRAVRYYQEALQVETKVYQHCKQQQQEAGATLAITTLLQEVRLQMGETKQCLGKLHFKMGDFTKAMKTTLST